MATTERPRKIVEKTINASAPLRYNNTDGARRNPTDTATPSSPSSPPETRRGIKKPQGTGAKTKLAIPSVAMSAPELKQSKAEEFRLKYAMQMAVPIFVMGMAVDTTCEVKLYEDASLVKVIDRIPHGSRCKVLCQLHDRRDVCGVMFAHKVGYIKAMSSNKLTITPASFATCTVDKHNWQSKIGTGTSTLLSNCVQKYDISPGCVMHVLFDSELRKYDLGDVEGNTVIGSLKRGTPVVVLQLSRTRYARVRKLDSRSEPGWMLAIGTTYVPKLGYILPDPILSQCDTGSRVRALGTVQALERNNGAYKANGEFVKGTILKVIGISPPMDAEVKIKVTPANKMTKGSYCVVANRGVNSFAPENRISPESQHVAQLVALAKRNDVEGIRELTMPTKRLLGSRSAVMGNINKGDASGKPAVFWALGCGNVDAARVLIRHKQFDVSVKDNAKHTALHYCSRRMLGTAVRDEVKRVELVSELVSAKAEIDARDESGVTPLMYAVQENNMLIASRLMELGADVSVKTVDKMTAKSIALEMGFKPLHDLLVARS